jgi:hypothetical protein
MCVLPHEIPRYFRYLGAELRMEILTGWTRCSPADRTPIRRNAHYPGIGRPLAPVLYLLHVNKRYTCINGPL